MKYRNLKTLGVLLFSGVLLAACGNSRLSDQASVSFDPFTQSARLEIDMADGVEVAMAGDFQFGNGIGRIRMQPATRVDNAKIVVELSAAHLIGNPLGNLGSVTELPNGSPFPVAVQPPLYKIPVTQQGAVRLEALLSIVPELQLGALVHINQFSANVFPAGVSICQNFRNSDRIAFAAVCLYGPGSQGSGGIFVGGNLGNVLGLDEDSWMNPQAEQLRASMSQSRYSLSNVRVADQLVASAAETYDSSREWQEQRHDPRRRLSGSNGSRALRNAERILKVRR
jgi:hypothetical protein